MLGVLGAPVFVALVRYRDRGGAVSAAALPRRTACRSALLVATAPPGAAGASP